MGPQDPPIAARVRAPFLPSPSTLRPASSPGPARSSPPPARCPRGIATPCSPSLRRSPPRPRGPTSPPAPHTRPACRSAGSRRTERARTAPSCPSMLRAAISPCRCATTQCSTLNLVPRARVGPAGDVSCSEHARCARLFRGIRSPRRRDRSSARRPRPAPRRVARRLRRPPALPATTSPFASVTLSLSIDFTVCLEVKDDAVLLVERADEVSDRWTEHALERARLGRHDAWTSMLRARQRGPPPRAR